MLFIVRIKQQERCRSRLRQLQKEDKIMGIENKIARIMRNTGPARFFVPVGIILIVFGIILMGFNTDNYVLTTGKITSVAAGDLNEGQQQYDVSFTYEADGKTYEGTFDNLSGDYSVGSDIKVYYDPEAPEKITNNKMGFLPPVLIGAGAVAVVFGVYKTVKAFQKSKALDESAGRKAPSREDSASFKTAAGVTEYYFRFDGNSLKPGYLIEDADRKPLFEGKMLKNALVGARSFEFIDHTTGRTEQHDVGHTMTQTYNNEFFSASSWFKIDGENIWDVLHGRGLRMNTDLLSRFPNLIYDVTKGGEMYARIESTSIYVHEDDAAKHRIAVPTGRMYYRFWTASDDFETLFLIMFAVSETEQAVAE